jgi:hypothetical protein
VLTQSAYDIDEAAMNVKSCLKVDNGLLYITVSLKLEEARLYTTTGGARRGAAVARQLLRGESCVYAPSGCTLTVTCGASPG